MPRDREKFKEYQRNYYRKHRDRKYAASKERDLRVLYGMSKKEYDELLEKQNNKCAICKSDWNKKGPTIDHDHGTGKVRGILCSNCNWALGLIHDNRNVAWGMIDYLCDSQKNQEVR